MFRHPVVRSAPPRSPPGGDGHRCRSETLWREQSTEPVLQTLEHHPSPFVASHRPAEKQPAPPGSGRGCRSRVVSPVSYPPNANEPSRRTTSTRRMLMAGRRCRMSHLQSTDASALYPERDRLSTVNRLRFGAGAMSTPEAPAVARERPDSLPLHAQRGHAPGGCRFAGHVRCPCTRSEATPHAGTAPRWCIGPVPNHSAIDSWPSL